MIPKVRSNFIVLCAFLEQPRAARSALAGLIAVQTLLLGYSAFVHSPTLNEPAHLAAGLSYWRLGRFDLYRVNPPLVKMVAALPVMLVGCNDECIRELTESHDRSEFEVGNSFLRANAERIHFLFLLARWACIPFAWMGAVACYLWARDLYGRASGVVACFFWCFEPNIVAHGSLMTPDAHAAALGIAAAYTFWVWLKKVTWSSAIIAGIFLGLAELSKTTLILFYPLWLVLWILHCYSTRSIGGQHHWLQESLMVGTVLILGLVVLNLGYGCEGSFTSLKDFGFVSNLLSGKTINAEEKGISLGSNSDPSWTSELPVPLPKNYLLGIDTQQCDFEDHVRPSYLGGEWRQHGWWYYYLYAAAIKIPLGLWILGLIALFSRILSGDHDTGNCDQTSKLSEMRRYHPPSELRSNLFLILPGVLILVLVSSKTAFSEHMRYALPAFPFAFVFVAQTVRTSLPVRNKLTRCLTARERMKYIRSLMGGDGRPPNCMPAVVILSCCWFFASSIYVYPHSLAYFNEVIGGPLQGRMHLLGSNLDWGQDLYYAKSAAEATCSGSHIWFDTTGFPECVGSSETVFPVMLRSIGKKPKETDQTSCCYFVGVEKSFWRNCAPVTYAIWVQESRSDR